MAKGVTIPIVYKADLSGVDKSVKALGVFQNRVSIVNKALSVGMTAAATVATTAIAGIGFAVTKGFGRLQQIENATFMLKGLGHEGQAIEQIMDSALASVKGTAFGLGDAAEIAAQAVAAGIKPGEDLTRILSVLADTAAITGRPLSEIQSIMGKVVTTNKAYRTELQQLADRGLPIYQMLAETLGVTEDEVLKLASAGEISADILVDALENKIGGAALKMGDSTSGAFANTLAAIQRVGANLIGPIYDQFGEFFRAAIEGLEPVEAGAKAVGEAIGEFLNPKLDKLVDGVRNLSPFLATIGAVFETMGDRAGTLGDYLRPIVDAFAGTLDVLAPLTPMVQTLADVFAELTVGALDKLVEILPQIGNQLLPALVGVIMELLPPFTALADVAIKMLAPVLLELATAVIPILVGVLEVLTPILDVVGKMIESLDGFLVLLAIGIWGAVRAFAAYKAIMTIITGVQVGMAAASYGAAGASYALTGAQKFGLVMTKLLSGEYLLQLGRVVSLTVGWIASKAALIGQTIATNAATVAQKALNLAMKLNPIGLVIAAVTALIGALIWFFTQTELGQKIWGDFVQFAIDVAQGFADWFVNLFTVAIPEAWASFTANISEIWDETITTIGDRFAAFGDFFRGLINGYLGLWSGFINAVIDGVNWMIGKINSIRVEVPNYDIFGDLAGKTFGFNFPRIPEFTIPMLAEGGIVDRPTLAMIGEAGPEAVVPLGKGGYGTTVNITVNAGMGANGARIGEEIIREIKRYERQSGPVFARA